MNEFVVRGKMSHLHGQKATLGGTDFGVFLASGRKYPTPLGKNESSKGRVSCMRFKKSAIGASAAILGMTLALPSIGMAVTNGDSAQNARVYAQASSAPNPKGVDDATLKRTAAAYVKVRDIAVKAQQEINSTDDTAKKQQLMAESESAKLAAVKEEGMEPEQYNSVIVMVKNDNSLQQKFLSYVQELGHAS